MDELRRSSLQDYMELPESLLPLIMTEHRITKSPESDRRCAAAEPGSTAGLGLSTSDFDLDARRRRRDSDECQRVSVVFELLARRQLQVGPGFVGGEPVGETHRVLMVTYHPAALHHAP